MALRGICAGVLTVAGLAFGSLTSAAGVPSVDDLPLQLLLTRMLGHVPGTEAATAVPAAPAAAGIARVGAADTSLDRLIARAMSTNPLLGAKRSEVSAAQHDIEAARWQFGPSFSTQLQKGSGSADQYGSALRADQPLWAGGRLEADLDTATSRKQSARLGVEETGLGVALQVVSAYQQLQSAQAQVAAIGAYRVRLGDLSSSLERRIDSGVSPAAERSLMSARLAQAQNDLAGAKAAEASAAASLRRLVGDDLRLAAAPRLDVPADVATPPALCALDADGNTRVEEVLDRNPAVRRSQEDTEAARASVRSQRAALRPNVLLRVEQPVGHVPEAASKSTRVSVVLSYTPNAGLSTISRVSAGGDRVAALQSQTQSIRRDIGQQIRTECAEQSSVAQRAAGYRQAKAYTGDVLASYMRLFVAGKRGWLDVLNAAREDFENEQGGAIAVAALQASQYRLRLLTGEFDLGLATPADAPSTKHPLLTAVQEIGS